ncbi:MAG: hypothetical protein AAFR24_09975 [Cyanobacteria bacterium J06627_3]
MMSTLFDTHLVALHSQHSIQSHDLLMIFDLAEAEGMVENIDSYSFDDLLGLTVHLFVTTQSPSIREQLALQLSKFGSAAVLPLIKILCRVQSIDNIQLLVQKSLETLAIYPLIIGLGQVLDHEVDISLRTVAMQLLIQLIQENDQSVLLILPKLVSKRTWQLIKLQLLAESPYPKFNTTCVDKSFRVQVHVPPCQYKEPHDLENKNRKHDQHGLSSNR